MAENSLPPHRPEDWLQRLQNSGYRLTSSRRAVVKVLAMSDHLLTATEIYEQARQYCDSLGLVTVYRTIDKLEALQLVERVHLPGNCHAFAPALQGHQHLLVCSTCGRAEYFSGDQLQSLMDRVSQESGFQIDHHWLQLFGICDKCQPKTNLRKDN
jgi:Fur family transcriptional regulator, ferric uptake regulator